MSSGMRLEIGSGKKPTPGYVHNDVRGFDDIEIVCNSWEIDLPSSSLEEVIALGVVEHHSFGQVEKTFKNVCRMLKRGGRFIFDVPDLLVWSEYLYNVLRRKPCPFSKEHVLATIYGWQRWEGDEHKSGWTRESLADKLRECGFATVIDGEEEFRNRPELWRRRLDRPEDAHIRIVAIK
mgnify:CR=1 FL=1